MQHIWPGKLRLDLVNQELFKMKSGTQRLIVVLGMHRSGTSAIARGLKVLRVDLGNHLLPPDRNINDAGYWEDVDLNQLNIEMLHSLGTDWHHLAPLAGDFVERLRKQGFMLRAVELVREKVGNLPVFGFKDPRTALLLPFWTEVFAHTKLALSYVLAVRNPISVIRSLAKRDKFDLEKSALLWLAHTISMIEGTSGAKSRVLVDYDCLMRAPDHEMQRIAAALNLSLDSAELQIYVTEFLDKNLRHTVYDVSDLALNTVTKSLVHDIYAALHNASRGAIGIDDSSVSEQVAKSKFELARWEYPLSIVDPLFHAKRFASVEIAMRDSKIGDLQERLEQTQSDYLVGRRAIADRELKINELNDSVAQANSQIQDLQYQLDQLRCDLLGAQRATADRDLKLAALNAVDIERGSRLQDAQHLLESHQSRLLDAQRATADRDLTIIALNDAAREGACRIQELQHRVEHHQDLLLGTQRALAAADLEAAELKSRVSDKELQINALGQTLSDSQRQIGNLRGSVGAYEQQITELARQADFATSKIETLEATVTEQVASIRAFRGTKDRMQSEVDEKRDLLAQIDGALPRRSN
jgi:O-antigen biosynthesis protein